MSDETTQNIVEEFKGSITNGEVQISLNRFMDILEENDRLKNQNRELTVEYDKNPWRKWEHFAHTVDSWRIIPRILMVFYMWMLYSSVTWFQSLSELARGEQVGATDNEAMLISVVVGAGAAWFGAYVATGGKGRGE